MEKCLACRSEVDSPRFVAFMQELNQLARSTGLQEYATFSRVWEYPWLWQRLQPFEGRQLQVLDVGSERSPFPWFLATRGFRVMVSDLHPNHWRMWGRARQILNVPGQRLLLDAQHLSVPTSSVDIYLSVSVVEHIPDKRRAIEEAARVLRPGGLFVMTFDICEPEMGMTFPAWNGQALSLRGFDELFRDLYWFEPGLAEMPWNTDAMGDYLSWHRTTAPHHNYVTGAAVVKRSTRIWKEPVWKDLVRGAGSRIHTTATVGGLYLHLISRIPRRLGDGIRSQLRRWLKRGASAQTALRRGSPR